MMEGMRAAKTLILLVGAILLIHASPARANRFHFPLKLVNQQLVDQAGHPFPLLADTATALFARLDREQALEYLRDRRIRGFTAIRAALVAGPRNHAGAVPFDGGDLARPGEPYFAHVEQVIRSAEALGLLLCLDPGALPGQSAERARGLGRWLGARYARYANIAWTLDPGGPAGPFLEGIRETAPRQLVLPPPAAGPVEGDPGGPTPRQVRRAAYQALLRGASHAYVSPIRAFGPDWRTRLELPGGASLAAARRLLDSRPAPLSIDRTIVREPATAEPVTAARAGDGSFALVYLPSPRKVVIDMRRISGKQARAWWFDPRSGQARQAALAATTGSFPLVPPAAGPEEDWVLVLDDAGKWPGPPGLAP
jgi:hypothetical protein